MDTALPAPAPVASKATILIVDDTPDNLKLLSGLLKESYRVRVANNGRKALEIAAASPAPDLILLDVMMPDMDGYEVCAALKRAPETRDIPVIFLTGRVDTADRERGFAMGAVDYIAKPVDPPTVLQSVAARIPVS
ncbi:response regulator [Azospirillum formosense]|uniref:Response regulator n=1 Tax=Azospirillum formosense TaxID=861533 RepID=A0ABX2KUD4_9PROT|nr:response regulator [Azospirillum formosense]NUB18434.1 response regulator [Azospirillum formosense]